MLGPKKVYIMMKYMSSSAATTKWSISKCTIIHWINRNTTILHSSS